MLTLSSKPVGDLMLLFCAVRVQYGKKMYGNSCCTCSTIIFPFLTMLAGKTVIGALSLFDCSVGQSSISRLYGASSRWQRFSACVCSWFVNQLSSVSRFW